MKIEVGSGLFAVLRLPPDAPFPAAALEAARGRGLFATLSSTAEELSLVLPQEISPDFPDLFAARSQGGRRLLRVAGTLDFSLTGILSSIAAPLAEAGVSIFAVSTYDTDYLLVEDADLPRAIAALRAAGFEVSA